MDITNIILPLRYIYICVYLLKINSSLTFTDTANNDIGSFALTSDITFSIKINTLVLTGTRFG